MVLPAPCPAWASEDGRNGKSFVNRLRRWLRLGWRAGVMRALSRRHRHHCRRAGGSVPAGTGGGSAFSTARSAVEDDVGAVTVCERAAVGWRAVEDDSLGAGSGGCCCGGCHGGRDRRCGEYGGENPLKHEFLQMLSVGFI